MYPILKSRLRKEFTTGFTLGLSAFEKPLKLNYSFFNSVKEELFSYLDNYPNDQERFKNFLEEVRTKKSVMEKEIDEGRDKLIELNSFNEKREKKLF